MNWTRWKARHLRAAQYLEVDPWAESCHCQRVAQSAMPRAEQHQTTLKQHVYGQFTVLRMRRSAQNWPQPMTSMSTTRSTTPSEVPLVELNLRTTRSIFRSTMVQMARIGQRVVNKGAAMLCTPRQLLPLTLLPIVDRTTLLLQRMVGGSLKRIHQTACCAPKRVTMRIWHALQNAELMRPGRGTKMMSKATSILVSQVHTVKPCRREWSSRVTHRRSTSLLMARAALAGSPDHCRCSTTTTSTLGWKVLIRAFREDCVCRKKIWMPSILAWPAHRTTMYTRLG
mmetsp:Transcript_29798/g.78181  ORF Transcript_29798/g.78181 Transcript_29798/m.78181 type:complete len:284 (-) Transcript_29798:392-1243(-)